MYFVAMPVPVVVGSGSFSLITAQFTRQSFSVCGEVSLAGLIERSGAEGLCYQVWILTHRHHTHTTNAIEIL